MRLVTLLAMLIPAVTAVAAPPLLLPASELGALANEVSGETAKRNLEGLARFHRQRASRGFHAAAELILERAREYGLSDAEILTFPADGTTFYGTQKARRAWDADVGELEEIVNGAPLRIASYAATPIALAEDSESADVTSELVDVGSGATEADYSGKDVKGKLVLVSGQPWAAEDLAIDTFGAAGIISYGQNQPTAWSGDDQNLVRWGHLRSFAAHKTFGFMVSPRTAHFLQARLAHGETIRLHALVKAGQHAGVYDVVTATIPGADPALKEQEIAFSCHLDHQRPGANDNASGCVTILESARTLAALIRAGTLPRPARTIRFIWPPEVEGTVTLLNARPEFARRIKAVIHMDMVGGGPETKAVFHVTRGPRSLPSFVHDIAWAFASWINAESYEFAATGMARFPLTAPEGGKEPLRAEYAPFTMGSDHDVYQDSSFRIPSIYMNDWPDRYIHTSGDTAANIDPTKLKRVALIGAASGYFLANFSARDVAAAERAVAAGRLQRSVTALERGTPQALTDEYEHALDASLAAFAGGTPAHEHAGKPAPRASATGLPRRRAEPRGPLVVFGYDYFDDHAKAARITPPALVDYQGSWGGGEEYAYEALNFANGTRSAQQITDELSAEYGPVPLATVSEYLHALRGIGILE